MNDIINLRQARKRKARNEKEKQAAENRVRFGQSKAEKTTRQREEDRQDKVHQGLFRVVKADQVDPPSGNEPSGNEGD